MKLYSHEIVGIGKLAPQLIIWLISASLSDFTFKMGMESKGLLYIVSDISLALAIYPFNSYQNQTDRYVQ